MEVSNSNGICIKEKQKLHIDAGKRAENCIISHAHSDHAKTYANCSYFMSHATKDLIKNKIRKGSKVKKLEFLKKFRVNGFEFSLHNSGHILGSAQVCVKASKDIAITTDFKLQKSLLMEPAEILGCDILVIETTFGLRQFNFPERNAVYEEMIKWVREQEANNRFVVLAGYAVGKAQELTAIANQLLGEVPIVHEKIFENNKVYEKHGMKLGKYLKLNHNLREGNILIMPPSLVNANILQALEFSLKKKVVSAMSSGWQFNSCFNKVFPLSDHADFSQLIEYVKQAEPKLVLTHHGYAREFARYVQRKLKIPARELSAAGQKTISEFG